MLFAEPKLSIADDFDWEIGDLVGVGMMMHEWMGAAFNNVEWRGNQLAESSYRFEPRHLE